MKTVLCRACSTPLTEDNPGVPTKVRVRSATKYKWNGRNAWSSTSIVCKNCIENRNANDEADWEESRVMPWFHISLVGTEPAQCESCSAPLLLEINERRKHVYCSETCRNRIYVKSVEPTVTACEVCETEFHARRGAKYCSSACRQKAYRNR